MEAAEEEEEELRTVRLVVVVRSDGRVWCGPWEAEQEQEQRQPPREALLLALPVVLVLAVRY
jgi:hypothetical protein